MSATYRAAVRTGLPDAIVVVDHFHVVQLANKMLSLVRRRTTAQVRGRRGRASDPEWKARRRLLRNREDLTDEQFARMWNPLLDEGQIGQTLLTAWIAKESLRNLLALARTGPSRHRVGLARWKFLTWCADSDIPEVRTRATTVDRWWPEIASFIDTGHSNAKSEGVNRVIKLVARNAFGFRNATNQRLRTRCVTTRRARGHIRRDERWPLPEDVSLFTHRTSVGRGRPGIGEAELAVHDSVAVGIEGTGGPEPPPAGGPRHADARPFLVLRFLANQYD